MQSPLHFCVRFGISRLISSRATIQLPHSLPPRSSGWVRVRLGACKVNIAMPTPLLFVRSSSMRRYVVHLATFVEILILPFITLHETWIIRRLLPQTIARLSRFVGNGCKATVMIRDVRSRSAQARICSCVQELRWMHLQHVSRLRNRGNLGC